MSKKLKLIIIIAAALVVLTVIVIIGLKSETITSIKEKSETTIEDMNDLDSDFYYVLENDFYKKAIYLANKKSNDEMMADIMEMSRSVLYGARGGQYISDALSDAVLVVENKRLKKAMIKMKMGLATKEPIDACLKNLEEHFNNAEISAFITVIKSLMQTGQLDEALKTLESNITREQSGVNKRRLVILENRTMAYVMIVAFDILGLMLYCIIMKVLDLQIAL